MSSSPAAEEEQMNIILKTRAVGLLLGLGVWMVSPAFATDTPESMGPKLQQVLDQVVSESPDHLGILVSVSAPGMHLEWSGASGRLAREDEQQLDPNQPFRIASVTKVFVAAAIFRLIEDGNLGLYDSIVPHVSPETVSTLESGGYDPKAITVAQLLGHTSGLFDFNCPEYKTAVLAPENKLKRWTRLEQIQFAMKYGKPVGRPGEKFSYSDTGYIILGEIIERASGQPMAAYVRRSLKLDTLHLKSTYWETLEPPPRDLLPRAHQYWEDVDLTDHDPSLDLWGGGGLVSNTADLNRFMRAFLQGRLFRRPSTLAMSLLPVLTAQPMRRQSALMLGVVRFGAHICWEHTGYWGTTSFYCPDIDMAVSATIDQSIDDESHGANANHRKLMMGLATVMVNERALRTGTGAQAP
jgi:D-alanyl-D-alanine carboxypeptidase